MVTLDAFQQLRLPDAWQAEAIRALNDGRDVIVQAPTGAGKTFVFEQFYSQRRHSGQIVYTVPTRALANDKFAEWNRKGWRVGITTGDLVLDVEAPLIVATLEAQQSPGSNISLYVIDEYQWLGDPLRGNHYEGVLMTMPATTQLLLLSGSVANPLAALHWLQTLGRQATLIEQKERPVPLEEMEIDSAARHVTDKIQGYWTRRLAAALREDYGPILVFAPHRKAAEKIALDAAAQIPCPQPLPLTAQQEQAAGPSLAKLLRQRIAYHHSGLSYLQRAGLVEPLAKGGQLRIVVATLGLSAGINFSLRSVLVTGTQYNVGGIPTEVTPAELLQMFGRAGRRGLDDQGYVLVTDHSPRLGQARTRNLRRNTPLPWRPLLRKLSAGEPIVQATEEFQSRLFTEEKIPLGIESSCHIAEKLPCGLKTDAGRARLVRREKNPAPFCVACPHRNDCLQLDTKPTLLWLWNRVGLLDRELALTRRGRVMSQFLGPEGLGVIAGLEDEHYPVEELIDDLANLSAGDRFSGQESRYGGRLAMACQKAFKKFSYEGFLCDGIPINYGSGGEEIVRTLRTKKFVPVKAESENVSRGDIDRLVVEWKSLLRQIAGGASLPEWPRWEELRERCKIEMAQYRIDTLPTLPPLTAEQEKPVSHHLAGKV
jgi:superfamily II DNA/RNA helicase